MRASLPILLWWYYLRSINWSLNPLLSWVLRINRRLYIAIRNWLVTVVSCLRNVLNWDLRMLLLYRRMNYLSFDGLVLNSFLNSFLRHVFNIAILKYLRNILCLIFDGIVISDSFFFWHVFSSLNSFIFNYRFFIRDIFNT